MALDLVQEEAPGVQVAVAVEKVIIQEVVLEADLLVLRILFLAHQQYMVLEEAEEVGQIMDKAPVVLLEDRTAAVVAALHTIAQTEAHQVVHRAELSKLDICISNVSDSL